MIAAKAASLDTADPVRHAQHAAAAVPPLVRRVIGCGDGGGALAARFRDECHALALQRRQEQLTSPEDVAALWQLLSDTQSAAGDGRRRIPYVEFRALAARAPPKLRALFAPEVFLSVGCDEIGSIDPMRFCAFAMSRVSQLQTRLTLSLYDTAGDGWLREVELESFIWDLIPDMASLRSLDEGFRKFYVCAAVRRFMFFLDPRRLGRVRISTLLTSTALAELFQLRDAETGAGAPAATQSAATEERNWFSAARALRVYQQYLSLDRDRNGMLLPEELANYRNGALVMPFIERVFQECRTYGGQMVRRAAPCAPSAHRAPRVADGADAHRQDYKGYLDFVLAMEMPSERVSLAYLFRLLDVQGVGYLNVFSMHYFYKHVQQRMRAAELDPVSFLDVKDEIFDMVHPRDPYRVTLDDLVRSGCGATVVQMLVDVDGFVQYDRREEQMLGPTDAGRPCDG